MEEFLSLTVLGLSHRGDLRARRRAGSSSPTPPPASSTSPTARSGCSAPSPTGSCTSTGAGRSRSPLAVVLLVLAPGLGVADRARDHARPRRRARDGADRRHDQPARRAARHRPVDLAAARGAPRPAALPGRARSSIFGVNVTGTTTCRLRRRRRGRRRPAAAAVPHRSASTCGPSVDSRPLALLHGARPDRSAALAWAIGCSLAALAGILVAPLGGQLTHTNLTLLIVNAYAAAMIGRLRSLPMTFLGAVLLGLADSYAIGYLPSGNAVPLDVPVRDPGGRPVRRAARAARARSCAPAAAHASREDIPLPSWRTARRDRRGRSSAIALVLARPQRRRRPAGSQDLRHRAHRAVARAAHRLRGQVSLCQMSFAGIGAIVDGAPRRRAATDGPRCWPP